MATCIPVRLGVVGLTDLRVQFYDATFVAVGVPVTTSFGVFGNGNYGWFGTPPVTQGFANFYSDSIPTISALSAINASASFFPAGAIAYTYTVTNSVGGAPIDGVQVWITTDLAGTNVIWSGVTDAFGIARDVTNTLPQLNAGTYYFWRQKAGWVFTDPDTEIVS